ncbi:hypothetical protein IJV79_02960, partial [bacterium]|nr:hypothetical protein [bacterium]
DTIKNTVMKHAAGFDDKVSISSDPNVVKYWTNVFNALQKNGSVAISDDKLNSPDWLQEQLTIGNITIARQEEDGSLAKKQYNTSLSYVAIDKMGDEVIALAQAEYEAEVNRIARKEKKIDNELACIETEHSALEQQKESIKAVQEHNIEKGFQLFS